MLFCSLYLNGGCVIRFLSIRDNIVLIAATFSRKDKSSPNISPNTNLKIRYIGKFNQIQISLLKADIVVRGGKLYCVPHHQARAHKIRNLEPHRPLGRHTGHSGRAHGLHMASRARNHIKTYKISQTILKHIKSAKTQQKLRKTNKNQAKPRKN